MKIGIIRCEEHSNECAGFNCFPAMRERTGQFTDYETIELVGFDSCGGCARNKTDRILARAACLKEKGAEIIHLGNCLISACPFKDIFKEALTEKIEVPIIENTH